ncbi:MAG: type I DNA topoisomerase [Clostridia bacterium]|nr:type I DNA topoisomerase [Clostridia bacterium]
MAGTLVIVESPAKAKTIERILGKQYTVKASAGHLRDLPEKRLGVDIEHGFAPQYINVQGKAQLIKELREAAEKADTVILATDPDREGEAISWHLAYLLGINCDSNVRVTFNEITEKAVKQGFEAPRKIDMNLVDTYQARRVLDRIVGYKVSPLLWKKVKKGLSAGRVQSVAVRIICDREAEIEAFDSKEFWTVEADLSKQEAKQIFSASFHGDLKGKKISLSSKEDADKILAGVEGKDFTVKNVTYTEKKKSPAPPFTTSTLQQEASKRMGFSSSRTMSLAQQLYEGLNIPGVGHMALVTYIRTDSVRVADDAAGFAAKIITEKYGKEYLPSKRRFYKNRNSSQDAHEAIRPSHLDITPESVKDKITNDQFRLYKLIYERFIASQMADAVYDVCNVDITAGDYLFKTAGRTVKFAGYTAVYAEAKDEGDEEDAGRLPRMEAGEVLCVHEVKPLQHFTQPPLRFTEATLIKALEEYGIGRPSTYAPTLSVIQERNYVAKEKKFLIPTDLGKLVNELLKKSFRDIVDVKFTAQVESTFDEIEEGKRDWVGVISEFYEGFEKELETAEKELTRVSLPAKESDVICELCGRKMVYKEGRFGTFLACPGYPECKNTKPIVESVGVKCPKCGRDLVYRKSKKGDKYISCTGYPDCKYMSWNVPTGEMCPTCGEPLEWMSRGRKKFAGCNNKECKDFAGFDRTTKKTASKGASRSSGTSKKAPKTQESPEKG